MEGGQKPAKSKKEIRTERKKGERGEEEEKGKREAQWAIAIVTATGVCCKASARVGKTAPATLRMLMDQCGRGPPWCCSLPRGMRALSRVRRHLAPAQRVRGTRVRQHLAGAGRRLGAHGETVVRSDTVHANGLARVRHWWSVGRCSHANHTHARG